MGGIKPLRKWGVVFFNWSGWIQEWGAKKNPREIKGRIWKSQSWCSEIQKESDRKS